MEPQFQTSFIPKSPAATSVRSFDNSENSINYFSLFSTLIFIIIIVVCGGLFAYEQLLAGQIKKADAEVSAARDAFQVDTIKELTTVSSRITATNRLLNVHAAMSQIFGILQTLTVKKVSFDNFVIENKDNIIGISMNVEGQSYNALAAQMEIFKNTDYIIDPKFVDFDIATNGNITTIFKATIDQNVLSYKNAVNSMNTTQ